MTVAINQKQAGSLCKDLGNENLAFVLLNRYVDLTEAIDEGNASLLDNSDFAEATNVPLVDDRTLPNKQVGNTAETYFQPNFRLPLWWCSTPSPAMTTKRTLQPDHRLFQTTHETFEI